MNKKLFLLASAVFASNALINADDNANAFVQAMTEKMESKMQELSNDAETCGCCANYLRHLKNFHNDQELQAISHTVQTDFVLNDKTEAEREIEIEKAITEIATLCTSQAAREALAEGDAFTALNKFAEVAGKKSIDKAALLEKLSKIA
ncbi:MAG: hypothetical protein WC707_00170 [Candidatus Babeliaceae bacterium]|jgi:hypothetical protein